MFGQAFCVQGLVSRMKSSNLLTTPIPDLTVVTDVVQPSTLLLNYARITQLRINLQQCIANFAIIL